MKGRERSEREGEEKNDEEKNHYKKLQTIDSIEELEEEAKLYVSQNPHSSKDKYEYKASFKTRRS